MSATQVCWDYIWPPGNRKPSKPGKLGFLLLDQEVQRGLSGVGEGLRDALRDQALTASLPLGFSWAACSLVLWGRADSTGRWEDPRGRCVDVLRCSQVFGWWRRAGGTLAPSDGPTALEAPPPPFGTPMASLPGTGIFSWKHS